MNSKPLSQDEFQAKKQEALQNEPVARQVPLNSIELTDNSYKDGVVKVGGKTVSASKEFFQKLGGILHISGAMQRDLTGGKDKDKGKGDDGQLFGKMVEAMKALKTSKNGGGGVTIIGNPTTGELTGVTDRGYNRIPNAELFGIAESLINRYPILSPVDIDVTGGGMGVGISLLSNAEHPFKPTGPNGPDGGDETFRFGFTLNNGAITSLGDFAYRLVCTNGMMGIRRMDQFQLKDLSNESIRKMFEHISEAEKRRFIPVMFEQNMQLASKTPASYREIEQLYKKVVDNLRYEEDELKKHFKREIAQTFFQGYVRASAKLVNKGIDPLHLTDKQKSFIITGQNMWDVINNLTWLGSNDGGYQWKNQKFLQKLGGKTLSEEFDLANVDLLKL
jgi:hypothetical protein